jgi:hypothetical protein
MGQCAALGSVRRNVSLVFRPASAASSGRPAQPLAQMQNSPREMLNTVMLATDGASGRNSWPTAEILKRRVREKAVYQGCYRLRAIKSVTHNHRW